MSPDVLIDTICAYLNSITSFFATLQRLKNEFYANPVDYATVLLRILSTKTVLPHELGVTYDISSDFQKIFVSALISWSVYQDSGADWTEGLNSALKQHAPFNGDHWMRGTCRPRTINLQENHYMTSSKARVYMAVYKALNSIVLSLPGTNSRSDWLSNLHSATTDFSIAGQIYKVHRGFLYIAQCLSTHPEIRTFLEGAKKRGITKLLLCGHSQAGAVVSLLSEMITGFEVSVITFGSGAVIERNDLPRCTSFVRCVYGPSFGQDWQIDPVPLMDDGTLSNTSAQQMYPMGMVNLLLDSPHPEIRKTQDLKLLLNAVLLNFSAAPHSMSGYLRCICKFSPYQSDDDDDKAAMIQLTNK